MTKFCPRDLEGFKSNNFRQDSKPKNLDLFKNVKSSLEVTAKSPVDLQIDNQEIIDSDNLLNMYPNHIFINKNDKLYATPILVGDLDLQLSKLSKNKFDKVFDHVKNSFENSVNKITE